MRMSEDLSSSGQRSQFTDDAIGDIRGHIEREVENSFAQFRRSAAMAKPAPVALQAPASAMHPNGAAQPFSFAGPHSRDHSALNAAEFRPAPQPDVTRFTPPYYDFWSSDTFTTRADGTYAPEIVAYESADPAAGKLELLAVTYGDDDSSSAILEQGFRYRRVVASFSTRLQIPSNAPFPLLLAADFEGAGSYLAIRRDQIDAQPGDLLTQLHLSMRFFSNDGVIGKIGDVITPSDEIPPPVNRRVDFSFKRTLSAPIERRPESNSIVVVLVAQLHTQVTANSQMWTATNLSSLGSFYQPPTTGIVVPQLRLMPQFPWPRWS